MELEVEDAQICRLCGQCESIYIDVFGEEGTKRYLGLKIHSKINILIDERDPLPKAICVQCLGKLEFVCDFQEECLRTQELLRDRFNLPPPSDVDDVKAGETFDSQTNNNSIEKNRNPPDENDVPMVEERRDVVETCSNTEVSDTQQSVEASTISKEIDPFIDVTNVDGSSTSIAIASVAVPVESIAVPIESIAVSEDPISEILVASITRSPSPRNSAQNTRWLRSKVNADNALSELDAQSLYNHAPIANRLRSHGNNNNNSDGIIRIGSNTYQNLDKPPVQKEPDMIQIPTSTLNKVLSSMANSPNMQVSVKESTDRNGESEDINFTVELRKKQNTDFVTVLAKVFPDQGSCMVDPGIVKLLENQNGLEIRSIVNKVFNRSESKDDGTSDWTDCNDVQDRLGVSQNPEELFKMDGEEIRVDDNIEHVTTDNQSRYVCRLCRKKYERRDKCTVHVKTHLGIKQFVCTLCSAKFVCKSDVIKHIRCSHTNPRPIQCLKCPKRFRSKFDLTEHDNVHKGVKPYACQDCGQSYHHKVSLQMHAKSHLPSQNLACEYCGKVFPFRTRLLSHIASVHLKDRRNFRCHFCYNLYSSLSVLNEHIKTRHTATHTCETCGKKFKVASKYKAHVLQHTNPKPFVCHVCNNKYASKAFLNEHLLKHEGVRNHVCQKCGATFAQASHLAAHRHVHGEKKYACPDCGKRFNRQDNMKVHRKRHFKPTRSTDKQKSGKTNAKDTASIISIEK